MVLVLVMVAEVVVMTVGVVLVQMVLMAVM